MPVLFRMRVIPLVLLLALVFAFLLNWPVLLHFYDILSRLEHVRAGFVISIPFVLVAALNFVFMPFSGSLPAQTLLCPVAGHRFGGELRHTEI